MAHFIPIGVAECRLMVKGYGSRDSLVDKI